jgi:3-hydroxybutyryl-CoA dehydrogenase
MKIGVVGAGVMGLGVAQCFASGGHEVLITDPDTDALASVPSRIRAGHRLQALIGGRSSHGGRDAILPRIHRVGQLGEFVDAEFVVECAPERRPVKEQVFRDLDRACRPGTVLASCTSAIPIGLLGAVTGRPDRVIGTHFMNPAPLKNTVEVIRSVATSDDTLRRSLDLLATIGKKAIVVGDAPGFVSNRVLMIMINQAIAVVYEGTAAAVTVDEIFEGCTGHKMGPLRTADLIGLDVVLDSLLVLRDCTGSQLFEPCPLLIDLVRNGCLGRKSGRGLHEYPAGRPQNIG